jgi:hypothetical protein
MKRNQNEAKRRRQTLRVWSLAQAQAALPYIGSVMRSLREHRLEAQAQQSRAEKLARRPGRPDRSTIIALEDSKAAAAKAQDAFETALHELHSLDIYCLDPNQALALIPFVHDKQLAWYVYDLFDAEPLRFWRFHSDPLETRRPLAELDESPADDKPDKTWLA